MTEKQCYKVTYEVRKMGAIGIFYPLSDYFEATSKEDARKQFADKYIDKYELSRPVYCYPVYAS